MPSSRTCCTNAIQAASFVGTGTPFEHMRPGIDNKFADSASANAAFSIATQPPNVLVRGSVDIAGSWPGTNLISPGLSFCAAKTTLAAGYKTPRISWLRSAWTCCGAFVEGACAMSDNRDATIMKTSVNAILCMRPRLDAYSCRGNDVRGTAMFLRYP